MLVSVLIPTFQRPAMIDRCLRHLDQRADSCAFEVVVGVDGATGETPEPVVPEGLRGRTRVVRFPRLGIIGVRRGLLELARGEIALWLNDDSLAQPGLIDGHAAMHRGAGTRVVSGGVDWQPVERPTLFDRVVQSTGLVFFRQSDDGTQDGAVGGAYRVDYRNCFGLNMSFPVGFARGAGGIPEIGEVYGYDDIELAHRLAASGAEIWRAPGARVVHDHRLSSGDVHRREYLLGRTAWHYAGVNPSFAMDLFGRNIRGADELAYCAAFLARERRDAQRLEASFLGLADLDADDAGLAVLPLLAEHWTLLKRYLWRWGLLDAARGIAARWSLLRDGPEWSGPEWSGSVG